eukprot:CAMPEP_0204823866 /NCGR_PEP_ID=MMETSP1346-20131115/1937_1 /ASSEMBLY_ACC=CAM_ASM_000771 /TAXON_ID=215587 /ORGANISM="Aplanochytrium stocchinoi, Strain GSBS06" /LENGTH=361 /DNA_ID=CAMNT_0051950709 /DNA_START=64 /DNA_END=1146 /DNA_ORIENTATION=-
MSIATALKGKELKTTGVEIGYVVKPEEVEKNEKSMLIHSNPNWSEWDGGIVGGIPSWLSPFGGDESDMLPEDYNKLFECRSCKKKLSFLLQTYAPNDGIAEAFHRSLYIFVCRNKSSCTASGKGVRVFRTQLPKINSFYPICGAGSDVDGAWKPVEISGIQLGRQFKPAFVLEVDPEEFTEQEIKQLRDPDSESAKAADVKCAQCHLTNVKVFKCSRCHSVTYCSRDHQKLHWKTHKPACALLNESNKQTDSEKLEDEQLEQDGLDKIAAGANSEVAKRLNNKDEQFVLFQKRISYYPDQVLRYSLWPNEEEASMTGPLWIANVDKVPSVPNCNLCGEQRKFEMQIMPQMLHVLSETYLDW